MKVLIAHQGTRGGGPQLQLEIARAMVALGLEVSVLYDVSSEVAASLEALPVDRMEVGRFARRAQGALRMMIRVFSQPFDALRQLFFARARGVDLIFEPMGHPLQVLPRRLSRICGSRVLTSIHDATRHPGEENAILSWIAKDDLRNTDGVVVYSEAVEASVRDVRAPVFRTVHGAFGKARREPRLHPGSPICVGFFGRIEQYKGLERLASALLLLQGRGYDVRAQVVGRGTVSRSTQIAFDSAGIVLRNQWIAEDEIEGVIAGFDVLALPYDEASQSGVVGFALNAGVPIVATPVGGLAEQVVKAGGMVASSMTADSFADAIEHLIRDHQAYAGVSRRQLRAASEIFSWEQVASDIRDALQATRNRR